MKRWCWAFGLCAAIGGAAFFSFKMTATGEGELIDVGSDGSDGDFDPTEVNTVVDLGLALTGTDVRWTAPGQGHGVYDPEKWAVVFKYRSVRIRNGVEVTFKNHPSRAPVVWLVQENVTIESGGEVNLDGQPGHSPNGPFEPSEPGTGGFRGGIGRCSDLVSSGAGFGPGGGPFEARPEAAGDGGSYGTQGQGWYKSAPTYGNESIMPLIGGSGGAGSNFLGGKYGGCSGGGSILIAAGNGIDIGGTIRANGGTARDYPSFQYGGGGSGGAIRLIGNTTSGLGTLQAVGGRSSYPGGAGRIRIEAHSQNFVGPSNPIHTTGDPGDPPLIWLPDSAPSVRPVSLGGQPVPVDPRSEFTFPHADVGLNTSGSVVLLIEAKNVPQTWIVSAIVTPKAGEKLTVPATFVSGDLELSTWQASLTIASGFTAIQVQAKAPPPQPPW
jgi:hypothetical protein